MRWLFDCQQLACVSPLRGALRFAATQRASHSQFKAVGKQQARIAALQMGSTANEVAPSRTQTAINSTSNNRRILDTSGSMAFVPPQSPLAYHNRLPRRMFHTLSELVSAPYAPHPLRVLRDVLGLLESEGLPDQLVTPVHIREIFRRVESEIEEITKAAELVADAASEQELASMMSNVLHMQQYMHGAADEGGSLLQLVDDGRISEALAIEVLKCQLRATSRLGMCEESVVNLSLLLRLDASHSAAPPLSTEHHEAQQQTSDLTELLEEEVNKVSVHAQAARVTCADHVAAMKSCAKHHKFDVCMMLYRQFVTSVEQGSCGAASSENLSEAIIAVAESVCNTDNFMELKTLIVDSDISVLPVSVPLYTSLIMASSRAIVFEGRMDFSLALYRRLRDVKLLPEVETYAALIAVCASMKDPTQAFAFYRESLVVCDPGSFPPSLYSHFIRSFVNAGYYEDGRKNLEVLLEAQAPLDRQAFHACLAGAPSSREASELRAMMQRRGIAETPTTLALCIAAECRHPRGVDSLLTAYDLHEKCTGMISDMLAIPHAPSVADILVQREPKYCSAIEDLCLRLRVDPTMDSRITRYLKPVASVAQAFMSNFIDNVLQPQQPTVLPYGSYVVVLAADVLSNLDELFVPSIQYFSAVIIPHSSIALIQRATARRVGSHVRDRVAIASDEFGDVVESRKAQLVRFLKKYHSVIHLMSVEEELAMSRDFSRYGIGIHRTLARSAGIAMNLARGLPSSTKVYKQFACHVVLASTKFETCGRFLIDNRNRESFQAHCSMQWWNPTVQPQWSPQGKRSADSFAAAAEQPIGTSTPQEPKQSESDSFSENSPTELRRSVADTQDFDAISLMDILDEQ